MERKALVVNLALLLALAAAIFVIKGCGRMEIAAGLHPPPVIAPSIWEEVSPEQIRFGEPRIVLTDSFGFHIVGWISSDEVLILRDTKPGGHGEAIEIFNAKTGEVRRLVEGRTWGKPLWSPWAKAVAYLLYNEEEKTMELVWHPIDGKAEVIGSGAYQPVVLAPEGKGAMAYSPEKGRLVGKVMSPSEKGIELAFSSFAPPGSGCGWKYDTAVSPDGEWQAVYNCEHFLLMDTGKGVIKEIDLGKEWGLPRWALEAQWSPDGKKLAIIATAGYLPNTVRFLLLLNPQTNELSEIPVPPEFVDEVSWAPGSRILLTKGSKGIIPPGFGLPGTMLVDVEALEQREVPLFPEGLLGGDTAWSPDGTKVVFVCRPFEEGKLGHVGICISPVEVVLDQSSSSICTWPWGDA